MNEGTVTQICFFSLRQVRILDLKAKNNKFSLRNKIYLEESKVFF